MRYLILSDIHANVEALEAVVADAVGLYQQVICLGDIVGYGPDPNAATAWVQRNCAAVIRGNHDRAAVDLDETRLFNPVAATATVWTNAALSGSNLEYLRCLPPGSLAFEGYELVHGAPSHEDSYLVTADDASVEFEVASQPMVFFGHTHLQGGFRRAASTAEVQELSRFEVVQTKTQDSFLVNPGSVGQPRDEDWKAAYAVYDSATGEIEFRRCKYDLEETQRKIVEAGLPIVLAERLALGR